MKLQNRVTGNFVARIENGDGSLFYELTLEPGETYEFKYNTKWKETPDNTITAKIEIKMQEKSCLKPMNYQPQQNGKKAVLHLPFLKVLEMIR